MHFGTYLLSNLGKHFESLDELEELAELLVELLRQLTRFKSKITHSAAAQRATGATLRRTLRCRRGSSTATTT